MEWLSWPLWAKSHGAPVALRGGDTSPLWNSSFFYRDVAIPDGKKERAHTVEANRESHFRNERPELQGVSEVGSSNLLHQAARIVDTLWSWGDTFPAGPTRTYKIGKVMSVSPQTDQ